MKVVLIIYTCILAAIFIHWIFMRWVGKKDD